MSAARQLGMFDDMPQQTIPSAPKPTPSEVRALCRADRDEAIDRVEANADEAWMSRAHAALMRLCCEPGRYTLTSDDVWRLLGEHDQPREPRALGAVFRRACAEGAIAKTGTVVQSTRRANHAREIAVWRVS